MKRDLARLLEPARGRGWSVQRTRSSHWKLRYPSGEILFTGSTPGGPASLRNFAADLRRVERRCRMTAGADR
jgi:hypothetical protein